MKEVFISFAVFVFCVSLTLFSQFNSPQVVNAAESETQSVQRTPVAKSSNVSNNNLFELDPYDPNPYFSPWQKKHHQKTIQGLQKVV